ncbi:MAG: DUF3299 domain-containing protein [Steroidobacteraceae bacterium]|jgi:hypothetical protein|nr:DUF3299 domain-containing protein [Gammaproteobacteria bacterium]
MSQSTHSFSVITLGISLLTLTVATPVLGITAPASQNASAPAVGTPAPKAASKSARKQTIRELDWEELIPEESRERFLAGPPPAVHDYLGEGGMAAQQIMDFSVNKSLNGSTVKIPGFIVPLDIGKDGLVSEFFLVPYFGACIHVPPPPPNQIVYVRMNKGIALDSIYEAYWITGKLKASNKTTRLGASAYQLDGSKVEIYKY